MNPQIVSHCQHRFAAYVEGFLAGNAACDQAVLLKKYHTLRVCRNIVMIANKLGMPDSRLMTARLAALFHDIGRFRQYQTYGTFRDAQSVDHAELGLEEIRRHDLLAGVPRPEKQAVMNAIGWHNRLALPDQSDADFPALIALLRDADKLDIYRVFAHHYEARQAGGDAALELDLPDRPTVSADVLEAVSQGRPIRMAAMQTLNDFKLLKLAWVYDLNCQPTCAAVVELGFFDRIAATLPPDPVLRSVVDKIRADLLARTKTADNDIDGIEKSL